MMAGSGRNKRRISLTAFLSFVILTALAPPLLLLALVVIRTAETDRVAATTILVDNSKVIASMVRGALISDTEVLRTVGAHVTAQDAEFGAALNLIREHFFGEATVMPSNATSRETEQGWSVSNLVDITPGETARLVFDIPLTAEEYLQVAADSAAVSNKISFGQMENNTLVAVVDGNGNIITRSVEAAQNLGKRVPTWEALLAVGAPSGSFNALAFDGTPIAFGFSTIEGTPGWVVVVGMPQALLDARWQNPLRAFGAGVVVAILVAVLLSLFLSRRITAPIKAMVARSESIARDSKSALPPAPETIVDELETLYQAQVNSHLRLTERANELELSSKRYQAVSKVGAMVTWRADNQGKVLDIEGWEDFTGRQAEAALGRNWSEYIHEEDLPTLLDTFEHAARARDTTVTVEARIRAKNRNWVWITLRAAVIFDAAGGVAEWIGTLEDIDDRKRMQLRISHMAYHDHLTGLPNRISLAEHFEQLLHPANAGQTCALLYIDLDKFKQANDTFGHAAGDALLKEVGTRLVAVLRKNDFAARLGGDEFAMVLGDLENPDYCQLVATRIVKSLSMPFEIEGNRIEIGASVGIALFVTGELSIEHVQFEADQALYRAKTGGRNRWSFGKSGEDERRA